MMLPVSILPFWQKHLYAVGFFLITFFSNLILSLNQGESHRIHPLPHGKRGKLEKKWLWGARFQKLTIRGAEFSEGQEGAKFSDGARFSIVSYHVFLQTYYFWGNIVINYSCHYVYSNIFDIAEFLTQNDHGPILSYNHQILFW